MNRARGLIVFIKNPEPGKVKTRLAKDIGDTKALDVYLHLTALTRTVASQVDATRYLLYHQHIDNNDEWDNELFIKGLQQPGNLGHRMHHAFRHVLDSHSKAVVIGSDCPDITPGLIHKAFDLLSDYDCVIGPTFDGGYYLLGFRQFLPDVFSDMPWSTENVLNLTTQRLKAASLSYHLLRTLRDIDDLEDYNDWISK